MGKRAGICTGVLNGGVVLVLRGSVNVCMLVNLESIMCVPSIVNLSPEQPERRKGTYLPIVVLYLSSGSIMCRCC